ncbi:MAG: phytoene/squalene synthase family protein [Bacteroidales bacterium]
MSIQLYEKNNLQVSKLTTKNYSTSFSLGVRMLNKKFHNPIYGIYGYVRYADEIVDTFYNYPQKNMLDEFITETYQAIERKISTNPIIDSFQRIVNQFKIEPEHIEAFLNSMKMDLNHNEYDKVLGEKYVYGSAEVVGLMCLRVFYHNDNSGYEKLKPYARKLGEAFQKINFLRDIQSDYDDRGRIYFNKVLDNGFTEETKKEIEENIEEDFKQAYEGIKMLHKDVRLGVYLAYKYYRKLFRKIKKLDSETIMNGRLRLPNSQKMYLLVNAWIKNSINRV